MKKSEKSTQVIIQERRKMSKKIRQRVAKIVADCQLCDSSIIIINPTHKNVEIINFVEKYKEKLRKLKKKRAARRKSARLEVKLGILASKLDQLFLVE